MNATGFYFLFIFINNLQRILKCFELFRRKKNN